MEQSRCLNGDSSTTTRAYSNFALNPPEENCDSYQKYPDLTSNAALDCISQMLLEEEMGEEAISYQHKVTFQATEKSFYDILGQKYPSTLGGYWLNGTDNQENPIVCDSAKPYDGFIPGTFHANDSPSCKHPVSFDHTSTIPTEIPSVCQLEIESEDSNKSLRNIYKLNIDLEPDEYKLIQETQQGGPSRDCNDPRSKKKPHDTDFEILDGGRQKQIAVYSDTPDETELCDTVLLLLGQMSTDEVTTIQKNLHKEIREEQNEIKYSKNSMKQDKNLIAQQSVDLCSILVRCSEAVYSNDHPKAIELMKKIRESCSPSGDSFQRLAYYFVDGLEARLAGTGSELYRNLVSRKPAFTDVLRAFQLYIASSPLMRSLFHLTNQSVYKIAKDATKVHIINYGVFNGLQWPSFFENFSDWKRTPPMIRITIIEEPEPGFRPNKRVNDVGRRLAFYAKRFNVPFEYQGIASKWENVKPEDLNICKDEMVIVSCLIKSEMFPDETTNICSPRDNVLETIKKIKPLAFIHGISNASHNTPFFLTRFRLLLSQYSCLFDMLDSTMPRDNPERTFIERVIHIPRAINAIACEGLDIVYRPETYKQWHARHLRAGFEQIPVDSVIIKKLKNFVKEYYHKNFFIDEDNKWVLMGWKGKVLCGLSIWKPNEM